MPLLYVMVAMLILIGSVTSSIRDSEESIFVNSELVARSRSMIIYRGVVVNFVSNNPDFSGVVLNNVISLPDWYMPRAEIKGFVQAGVTYVFHEQPPSGLVGVLANEVESVGVGTNVNGYLVSPKEGNTGIILPAAIPVNATVILQ